MDYALMVDGLVPLAGEGKAPAEPPVHDCVAATLVAARLTLCVRTLDGVRRSCAPIPND